MGQTCGPDSLLYVNTTRSECNRFSKNNIILTFKRKNILCGWKRRGHSNIRLKMVKGLAWHIAGSSLEWKWEIWGELTCGTMRAERWAFSAWQCVGGDGWIDSSDFYEVLLRRLLGRQKNTCVKSTLGLIPPGPFYPCVTLGKPSSVCTPLFPHL